MSVSVYTDALAAEALKRLRSFRFWKIVVRLLFIILKVKGYSNTAIADILSVSRKTVWEWQSLFLDGGLEALMTLPYKGQSSKLNAYGEQLTLVFDQNSIATLKEAQHKIQTHTGLQRSQTQVRKFLQRIKIKRRKVGQIPAKPI